MAACDGRMTEDRVIDLAEDVAEASAQAALTSSANHDQIRWYIENRCRVEVESQGQNAAGQWVFQPRIICE